MDYSEEEFKEEVGYGCIYDFCNSESKSKNSKQSSNTDELVGWGCAWKLISRLQVKMNVEYDTYNNYFFVNKWDKLVSDRMKNSAKIVKLYFTKKTQLSKI